MKTSIQLILYLLLSVNVNAQWGIIRPIDTLWNTTQDGIRIAFSKKNNFIAVALRENGWTGKIAIYTSFDRGISFQKKSILFPPDIEYQLFVPDEIIIDANNDIWILWRWEKYINTVPEYSYAILSKSTDQGNSFKSIYKFLDGGKHIRQTLKYDPILNMMHLVRDSMTTSTIYAFGQLYVNINIAENKISVKQIPLTSNATGAMDLVYSMDSTIHMVYDSVGSKNGKLFSGIIYRRSNNGGNVFDPPKILYYDTTVLQGHAQISYDNKKRLSVYYGTSDGKLFVMQSNDRGDSFSAPILIDDSLNNYSHKVLYDTNYTYIIITKRVSTYSFNLEISKYILNSTEKIQLNEIFQYSFDDFKLLGEDDYAVTFNKTNNLKTFGYLFLNKTINSVQNRVVDKTLSVSVYPNPFNSSSKVNISIPKPGRVIVKLYNILGQKVNSIFDDFVDSKELQVDLRLNNLSSGQYILVVDHEKISQQRKLVYLK